MVFDRSFCPHLSKPFTATTTSSGPMEFDAPNRHFHPSSKFGKQTYGSMVTGLGVEENADVDISVHFTSRTASPRRETIDQLRQLVNFLKSRAGLDIWMVEPIYRAKVPLVRFHTTAIDGTSRSVELTIGNINATVNSALSKTYVGKSPLCVFSTSKMKGNKRQTEKGPKEDRVDWSLKLWLIEPLAIDFDAFLGFWKTPYLMHNYNTNDISDLIY
uniref:Polymerase nucleotidyl transferase domain-containing protein n=1 Tax=Romanomermis culicivorax TaxID=13658 RepID=A0A915K2Q8_ROMCU